MTLDRNSKARTLRDQIEELSHELVTADPIFNPVSPARRAQLEARIYALENELSRLYG